jgi:hypothetical protein
MTPQKERLQPSHGLEPQKTNTDVQQSTRSSCSCQQQAAATQRQTILAKLRTRPLTTLEIRQELGICHPAARCMELRQQGYPIDTVWVNDVDSCGNIHRVARYILSNNSFCGGKGDNG